MIARGDGSGWLILDDGKGSAYAPRPPEELRVGGVILASDEVAWLRTRDEPPADMDGTEIGLGQQVEGAVVERSSRTSGRGTPRGQVHKSHAGGRQGSAQRAKTAEEP